MNQFRILEKIPIVEKKEKKEKNMRFLICHNLSMHMQILSDYVERTWAFVFAYVLYDLYDAILIYLEDEGANRLWGKQSSFTVTACAIKVVNQSLSTIHLIRFCVIM